MPSRELREADWAFVRELLVDVQARAKPGFVWEVRRWDGGAGTRPIPAGIPAREVGTDLGGREREARTPRTQG